VLETFEYIRDLTRYGVQFESYTEAHFRTTGMAGELMLAITAWIAKQERLRITERANAGIARARLHGTKSGRSHWQATGCVQSCQDSRTANRRKVMALHCCDPWRRYRYGTPDIPGGRSETYRQRAHAG
jgi:DNA invertase Pin-like site-specific DNA recombinase